ncbi:MAG: ABC transporter ATP-binding protein [Solirubrobacterales bacterium]
MIPRPSAGSSGRQRLRRLRGLAELLRPYRGRVAAMLVAMLAATAAALAPPYLAKLAIDQGIGERDADALTLIVIAFVVAALLYWAATYAQTYLVGWVGQRTLQDLRLRIFSHLQRQSIGFFSQRRTGVLISRMTNDVQALDQLVTDGVVTLLSSTLTLAGAAAILVALDWRLALVTFVATIPALAAGSVAFRYFAAGAYRAVREKIALITSYLQETLSGVRIVRAFGQEPRHIERFAELNEAHREVNMRTVKLNAAYFPAVEMLQAIGTAVIVIYGGYQALDSSLSADERVALIGTLVAFVGYLTLFFDPIQQLSNLYVTYQQGMAALDKIFDLLDTEPDMRDAHDADELSEVDGAIDFEDVWFSYDGIAGPDSGDDEVTWALREVSLQVTQGETLALVGETGAGKSTMAKLVARFYDPQRGVVRVDGHDLRRVTQKSLRRQLGVVPQEGFLFGGSVYENIVFGRPGASELEVVSAAKAVDAHEFIKAMPDGYDTEVGERGARLSAGQRQLVALARAFIADPRILVLDEATANVDVRAESAIEQGMRELLEGRTSIVIAHRLSTVIGADRIAVLDGGRVVEIGSHDELMKAGGTYARLYSTWAELAAA